MSVVQTFVCDGCRTEWDRKSVRGQRPRWCPNCRHRANGTVDPSKRCPHCGELGVRKDATYCKRECARAAGHGVRTAKPRLPKAPHIQPLSPLRQAIDAGDPHAILAAVRARCSIDNDCWIWQGRINREGYAEAIVSARSRMGRVHRVVAQAVYGTLHGAPVVHHVCANRSCVSPAHVVPVTHLENIGEMLLRTHYEQRIRGLERALTDLQADHPLLLGTWG